MRLVLDTNTVVSALLWGGHPVRLINAAIAREIDLISSGPLLEELHGVLLRAKFAKRLAALEADVAGLFEGYATLALIVTPALIPPIILRDPDDDIVLATALAARADLIVSGDTDLLDLGSFRGIAIVGPTAAVERVG